jgi:hypothetical protein
VVLGGDGDASAPGECACISIGPSLRPMAMATQLESRVAPFSYPL